MPDSFSEQLDNVVQHFFQDLDTIRTGRANPALVENLPVDSYGTKTPLQQLASIAAPEPQLLVIQPWDQSIVKDIEKAITLSSLGITPVVDGKIIRVPFPSMTEERRRELSRVVQEKAEQARVRMRGHREEAMKDSKKREKDGDLSADQSAAEQKTIQLQLDAHVQQVADGAAKKTEELMTV